MPAYDKSSLVSPWSISKDYRVAALQGDLQNNQHYIWLELGITFSFLEGATYFSKGNNYGNQNEVGAGWSVFTAAEKESTRAALKAWQNVSGIVFVEVDDDLVVGDLRFGLTSAVPTSKYGHAYAPTPDVPEGGDVWLTSRWGATDFGNAPSQTSGAAVTHDGTKAIKFQTLMHEIGHALGLSHPHTETGITRYTAPLPQLEDSLKSTVMSYASWTGQLGAPNRGIPTTPMVYDILAMQHLYGANLTHNVADTIYRFDVSDVRLETIWDAGGNDTIVVSNRNNIFKHEGFLRDANDINSGYLSGHRGVQLDLRPGQGVDPLEKGIFGGQAGNIVGFVGDYAAKAYVNEGAPSNNPGYGLTYLNSFTNIYIAFHAWIENAIGTSANDKLIGNKLNNRLTGGGGHDRIDGMEGVDTAVYESNRSDYTVTKTAAGMDVTAKFTQTFAFPSGWVGTGQPLSINPTDLLQNVERLEFKDRSLAFDLAVNESAGKAARLIGALLDTPMLTPEVVKAGIGLFDKGLSITDVAALVLKHPIYLQTAGSEANAVLVTQLAKNIFGRQPTTGELDFYTGKLNRGELTQAQLAAFAAETSFNETNIGLIGLQQTGLEFIT